MIKRIFKTLIALVLMLVIIITVYITLAKLIEMSIPDDYIFYQVYNGFYLKVFTLLLAEIIILPFTDGLKNLVSKKFYLASIVAFLLFSYLFITSVITVGQDYIIVKSPINPGGKTYEYKDVTKVKAYVNDKKFNFFSNRNRWDFVYEIELNNKSYDLALPSLNPVSEYDESTSFTEINDLDKNLMNLGIEKESSKENIEKNEINKESADLFLEIVNRK